MQNHNKPQGIPRIGSSAVLGHGVIGTLTISKNGKREVMAITQQSLKRLRPAKNLLNRFRKHGRDTSQPICRLMVNITELACEFKPLTSPNQLITLTLFVNDKTGNIFQCKKCLSDGLDDLDGGFRGILAVKMCHKSKSAVKWPNDPKLSHADGRVAPQTQQTLYNSNRP